MSLSDFARISLARAMPSASIRLRSDSAFAVRDASTARSVSCSCWIFLSNWTCSFSDGYTMRRFTLVTSIPRGARRALMSVAISAPIFSRAVA